MKKLMYATLVVAMVFIVQNSFALSSATGNRIADDARAQIGKPYVWGGKTTSGFDCSGLAAWAYKRNGYATIPWGTSHDQMNWCRICVDKRGSLLFFDAEGNDGRIDHVAISDGNGYMIHAVYGRGVVRERISSWYRSKLVVSASR